ncbi:MAG: ABC transporter ATP-binding protein [Chloroflexi bacterium]|nr:ABC transporter ATP-binding protein [Chloroflexota bacterium]
MSAIIQTTNLTKTYSGRRGVSEVSFEVDQGEAFGFLGPNGAGKTTTIRLLMGLLHADSGWARIGGLDCWKQSVAVKRLVGYAPGEPALEPDLTGGQILEYFGHLRGDVDRAYVRQLVERFELDVRQRFRHYSTGNKRKLTLIQAFMHRPLLLILDEPTNGLDPLNQQEFARLVQEARAAGSTVFLSSHVLSEVEQLCTSIGIIRDGQLVRTGDVADVKDIKHSEITVSFGEAVPTGVFERLPGVAHVEPIGGNGLRIAMQGAPDAVIKAAAAYPVVSLTTHEPSLEDIFLRYYTSEPPKETSGVA